MKPQTNLLALPKRIWHSLTLFAILVMAVPIFGYGQTKEYATVAPSSGAIAVGLFGTGASGVSGASNAADINDLNSYAEMTSTRIVAGLLGSGDGWLQLKFGNNLAAKDWVYIRYSDISQEGLVVGLGALLGAPANFIQATLYKNANASGAGSAIAGDVNVKFVTDNSGTTYIAVQSPNNTETFNSVRIKLTFGSNVNVLATRKIKIHNAYALSGVAACNPVAFAGDGEATGISVNLGGLLGADRKIVENPSFAIDQNTSNYSTLSGSLLSVVGNFSQSFYFPTVSEANSKLKVRLQLSQAVANVNLLGGYYVRAYNGNNPIPVVDHTFQGGLIGGLDLLGILSTGGIATLSLDAIGVYDRVEVGMIGAVGVNVGADLRIYGVTRTSASCPEPPPTASPLFQPVCANATIVSSSNADDPQLAVDDNFDSYATLRSDAGILVGLANRAGHLEAKFDAEVPAGKTAYIRIDYDQDVLKSLLAGSIGDLVGGLVNGLVLGNHFFEVQLKNGNSETLNTSSANLFASSNGQVKIVQDKTGRYYIAIKANQPFTNIRLTDRTTSVVGLLSSDKYLNVYSICYDNSTDICNQAFSTSYEGSGISLGLLQLGKTGVINAQNAIDDNETTFSEINLGVLSVAGSMSQYINYNSLSDPKSVFKIKLALAASKTLNVDLLGAYEVLAYNGNTEVYRRTLSSGLLNGTDLLGLLGGQESTITFAPGKAFDRIEIRVNGLLGVSAFESAVKVYDVKRFGPAGSGCEDPGFVLPPATDDPFEIPACDATVVDSKHADYPWLAADGNNESFATLTASSGSLLGIGAYSGFLEYEIAGGVDANKTTYVRIDMEDNILDRLLSGTLGNLVGAVGGLVLGDHYFTVEAKTATGGTTVLTGSSANAFVGTTGGDLRIVQDNIGRYYIAITPNQAYQNIKITEHFPALVNTKDAVSMKIFEACREIGLDNCLPAQFTSFDQSGLSLGLLNGAGVKDADHAISVNSSDYSEISTGTVAIAAEVAQRIYFNKLSAAGDTLKVRLQMDPASLAAVDLVGRYKIVTYNGSAVAETFTLQQGLINNLNLLDLFNSGGVQTLTFQTNTAYDRVDVVAGSLLSVALTPAIRLYEVKRIGAGCPSTTIPSPFENPVCVTTIKASSNADNISNLFDNDFDSYATLRSGSNSLLGQLLGGQPNQYTGFVELGFDAPVTANKTAYVRIDFEPTLLNKLLAGSIGGTLAGVVDGLILGDHFFHVQAISGNTIVLEGGSNDNFGNNNDRIRIVQDALGRYYIAITPTANFDAIRITDHTRTGLPLVAQGNSMNVYGACVDNPLTDCQPVFTTSYDAKGLSLDAAGLAGSGVTNANHAIDANTTNYSEISLGVVGVGTSVKQLFDFRKVALASEIVNIKLQYGSGALDANLIGGLEIVAYKGATPVKTLDVQSGLINGLNVLDILNNGATGIIPFAPGVEFDRISVGLSGAVAVGVLPALRVYAIEKDCNTPMFKSWKSFVVNNNTNIKTVKGGEEVEYTIHIRNTGSVALNDYIITDAIPSNTTFVSAANGGSEVGGIVTFSGVDIAAGATATVSFKVDVDADLTGVTEIRNVALVKKDATDPGTETLPPSPTDPNEPDETGGTGTIIPVTPVSTIVTWKAADKTAVQGGEDITYTIYIKNTGNQALTGVSITDPIPAGTVYKSGGTSDGTTITLAGINIPVGATVPVTFIVTVKNDLTGLTNISNVATVTAGGTPVPTTPADPTNPTLGPDATKNPGDPTLVLVTDNFALVSWKNAVVNNDPAVTTVKGGEVIEYTIYVRNTGNKDLNNVVINDPLPAGTTLVSGSLPFTIASLKVGATSTGYTFKVKVNENLTSVSEIKNIAKVISTEITTEQESYPSEVGNPNEPDVTKPAGTVTPVIPVNSIDLTLTGVSDGAVTSMAASDDQITYTVTVTNTGNKDLVALDLATTIPANTTSVNNGVFTANGTNLTFTIPTLGVGQTETYTFVVEVGTIDNAVVTSINNTVTASNALVTDTKTHRMLTDCTPVVAGNLTLTSSEPSVCIGGSITLEGAVSGVAGVDPSMIKWYRAYNAGTGAVSGYLGAGASVVVTPTTVGATKYYAVVDGAGFCFDNPPAEIPITVNALPATPTITPSSATVCESEQVTLTATGGTTYIWSKVGVATPLAETSATLTLLGALTDAGQYTVRAVNGGCTSDVSAAVQVLINPKPAKPVLTASANGVCVGEIITLTSDATGTHQWFKDGQPIVGAVNTNTLTVAAGGVYTAQVTDATTGCASEVSDGLTVTVNPAPVIVFNEPTSYTIEVNQTLTLPTYASEADVTYQWKDQTGTNFNGTVVGPFASPGTHVYTLIATNSTTGCQTASSVTIRVFNAGECPPVFIRVYGNDAQQHGKSLLGDVTNPSQAADQNPSTFSTLTDGVNVGNLLGKTFQNIKWSGSPIAAGTPVTVKLGKSMTVAQVIGGLLVEPIDAAGNSVGAPQIVDGDIANIVAGENIYDFTFTPTNAAGALVPYSGVKVHLIGLITAGQSVNLYEAYYHSAGTPDCTNPNGVIDILHGIERPIGGVGVLNALNFVTDATNAVDGNEATSALLNNVVNVNAYTRLEVAYNTPALVGDTLTIKLETPSSLLTVGLLQAFTIQPYLGNVAVGAPIHNDASLLNITLLDGGNKADVKFIANAPYDRIKILYGGLVTALSQLKVNEITRTIPAVVAGPNNDNVFEICPGDDITIPAPDNCTTYEIYDAITGGNKVDITKLAPGTHTLYVQTIRFGTCAVGTRTEIEVRVKPAGVVADIADILVNGMDPSAPLCIAPGIDVILTTGLSATSTIVNPIFHWYDAAGVAITGGANGTLNIGALAAGTYTYSVGVSGDGVCESDAADHKTVTFTILPTGAVTDIADILVNGMDPSAPLCIAPDVDVVLTTALTAASTITNPVFHWYDAAGVAITGGANGTLNIGKLAAGTYTYSVGVSGDGICESLASDRKTVTFTILPTGAVTDIADILVNGMDPSAPLCIAPDVDVVLTTALTAASTITNPVFHWYDAAGVAITGGANGTLNIGALAAGTYTYSVGVSGDGICESLASDRKTVTFTILPTGAVTDIADILVNGMDPSAPLCIAPDVDVVLTTALTAASTITNPVFHWYDATGVAITGGANGTLNIGKLAAGTYTYSVGVSGDGICESLASDRKTVTFTILPTGAVTDIADILVNGMDPSAPLCIAPDVDVVLTTALTAASTITNPVFHWYDAAGVAITGGANGTLNIGKLAAGTYTYSVGVSGDGICESLASDRKTVAFTILPTGAVTDIADILVNGMDPSAPLCIAPDVDVVLTTALTAASTITNPVFHWYDAAGVAITGGANGTLNIGKLAAGTYTYSVGVSGDGICESLASDRKTVTFTILPTGAVTDIADILVNGMDPSAPLCIAPDVDVVLTTALTAASTITNPVFHWYDAAGVAITGGANGTLNIGKLAAGTYTYSVGVSGDGICESLASDRKTVTFTILPTGAVTDIADILVNGMDPSAPLCIAPDVDVVLTTALTAASTITNPVFHWYDAAGVAITGGANGTLNIGKLAAGTYTYSVGVSGDGICESLASDRKTVTFTILPTGAVTDIADILVNGMDPSAPLCIAPDVDVVLTTALTAASTITNPVFHWYDAAGVAITGGANGTLNIGKLAAGTYTYSVGVSGDGICESLASDRKTVTFTILPTGAVTDIADILVNGMDPSAPLCIAPDVDVVLTTALTAASTITNPVFHWYDAAGVAITGGANGTLNIGKLAAGTYTYSVGVSGDGICESLASDRKTVTFTILPTGAVTDIADILVNGMDPSAPLCIAPDVDVVLTTALTAASTITNPVFHWYDAAGVAITGGANGTLNIGKLAAGTYTYSVGVSGDGICESLASDRKTVTFTILPTTKPEDIAGIEVNGKDPSGSICIEPTDETILTAKLTAASTITNPVFHWYDAAGVAITGGANGTLNLGVMAPGTYTYSVGVSGDGICESLAADRKVVTFTTVFCRSDLSITKVADQQTVNAGTNTSFTATITNNGPAIIAVGEIINLGEMPSEGLTITGYEVTSANGTAAGTANTATVTTTKAIAVGGTIVVKVTAAVSANAPATISNGIKVWGPDKPTTEDPDDEDETPEIPVIRESKMSITKVADQTSVKAGETTTFTLTIKNEGPADIAVGKDISLVERPGEGVTINTYSMVSSNATVSGAANSAKVTTTAVIPVGETIVVKVTATVDEEAPETITNGITVWGPGKDPGKDPEDDKDDTDPIPVEYPRVLAVDDQAEVKAGQNVIITVLDNDQEVKWAIDPSTVEIVVQPTKGTHTINVDGTVSYTADKAATGTDVFSYRVKDVKARWSNEAEVTVTILDNPLVVPNVFTPNNDNVNDDFVILGIEVYDRISLKIINRWGNEVYRNDNYKNDWNGSGLNAGTYFYIIEATKAGKTDVLKGTVLIKRN
ncbi:Ig-like domain-containing protein [Sphingobacterium sp. SYP-B4668]|uniref:Ig-like domain-containing protein n=1 Tax=Sphingobacterium sp. SYP-B4668 TaxID=2996035 RepID=UPI0022DE46AC|nr:gliding motility-associated C-terminal domain-containing protein [Sphingobacterium sp. SYP-B4668]